MEDADTKQKKMKILLKSLKESTEELQKTITTNTKFEINILLERTEKLNKLYQEIKEQIQEQEQEALKTQTKGRKSKKSQLIERGVIIPNYNCTVGITDKNYQNALTPIPNDEAYISLSKNIFNKLIFENGKVTLDNSKIQEIEIMTEARNGEKQAIKNFDIQLLRNIFTIIFNNVKEIKDNNISVYLPAFCKSMGSDMTAGKSKDILGNIEKFAECIGVDVKENHIYRLLVISEIDLKNNIIIFHSPYMIWLLNKIEATNKITKKDGTKYINPAYTFLVHSDISKERNKTAVEIVYIIVSIIQQRGENKGKGTKTKIHKKFKDIVYAAGLKDSIINNSSNTCNNQLKRAFTKAYELLKEKTELSKYYKNLDIEMIIPTITTLNNSIHISHNGVNKNYKKRQI